MIGRVISTKSKNTAVVLVERQRMHPLYKKAFVRSKKYLVDDQIGVSVGDLVEVSKVRPISKMKHFKIIKVLGKRLDEITKEKLKEQVKDVIEEIMPEEKEEKQQKTDNKKKKEEK